jgi:hypothetical protein
VDLEPRGALPNTALVLNSLEPNFSRLVRFGSPLTEIVYQRTTWSNLLKAQPPFCEHKRPI